MDLYTPSSDFSPDPHFLPPVAGSNLNGTLFSQGGWQQAGSEVDGFPVQMPGIKMPAIEMPDPSAYSYARPTEDDVSPQQRPPSPEILAPSARRVDYGFMNYLLDFDEANLVTRTTSTSVPASLSPSAHSGFGLEYNVPLKPYDGPWNGTDLNRRVHRRLVPPKASENVLGPVNTYHPPNTIGLDRIGATLWSKDTPGPMCSPTDLAVVTGVPISSPPLTVDLNGMYDLRYPSQLTAESRSMSPMQEEGLHRTPRPSIPDTQGSPGGFRWPFLSDDCDSYRPSSLSPLSSGGPSLLRGHSVGRVPKINPPAPTPRLFSSASVYPDPRQSPSASNTHYAHEPGVATGYYSEPRSDDERYDKLVNIPDPGTNFRRPWMDKRSTLQSAIRIGRGWISSLYGSVSENGQRCH